MSKYTEVILAAVTKLRRHPTAEQVFLEMKKEYPSIALGTVYKHLNALADEGLLLRITEPGSPDRYDRICRITARALPLRLLQSRSGNEAAT